MERTYLQWNLPNWITVTLMVIVGYTILSAVVDLSRRVTGSVA